MKECFVKIGILLICIVLISGCKKEENKSDLYHPNIEEYNKLEAFPFERDTIKFVLLADIHNNYNLLAAALQKTNSSSDISFIICCGDITDAGAFDQYKSYVETILQSTHPVYTVPGNHDYLLSGSALYSDIFGISDFSFVWGDYKIILFDNVKWGLQQPDFNWLSNEISDDNYNNIIACHKPPWDSDYGSEFRQIVNGENSKICLHGHTHSYTNTVYNGVPTLVSTALEERKYYIVCIAESAIIFKTVEF